MNMPMNDIAETPIGFAEETLGMTLYGLVYAVVHDGLTHRRAPWPWRGTPRRGYLARLVQAHRLHHAVETKHGTVSFGFLWAPRPEDLKAELKRRGHAGVRAPVGSFRD